MERRQSTEIASSNQGFPIINQFLDEAGVKDAAKDFAKNFVKERLNKIKENRNKTNTGKQTDNTQLSVIEKGQNLINKVKDLPVNVSTKGVGFEKTFGDKDKGFNATVFGRQDFGKPTDYGAQVGFNFKF
jgi:hypothetical protein